MVVRTSKSAFRNLLLCCVLACAALAAKSARAEESIIKRPGDHPNYSVEIEPHLLAAFLALPHGGGDGYGLGGRFTVPLMKNGFISSINNNIGIGFGLDWVHYSGCYAYYYGPYAYECPSFNSFIVPVVMQWNFFLSTHWSVFAEPGLALEYGTWGGNFCGTYVDARGVRVPYPCGNSPNHLTVNPIVLFIGGRFHFSESTSLTLRVGWPYFSIGVSFLP